jgi:soluble lytic murein transglycosylase-like protein
LPSILNAFCFEEAGKAYEINPSLLKSIAKTESNMDPKAVNINKNGSVDLGLMQINSFWIKSLGLDRDELISNPCYNAMTGAKILRQCIDRYGYEWEAVGCYNAVSKDKRINYSWKVFNSLKDEESKVKSPEAAKKTENKEIPASSLFFRIRDISTEER